MSKRVAIFGCGPAGMMVAHAATMCGWDFRIYSKKQKSVLHGAQYLHEPIPNITGIDPEDGATMLSYRLRGTPEEYRQKVYGEAWDGNTSPEDFEGDHYAWDLRRAYGILWNAYADEVEDMDAIAAAHHLSDFDLVISTVPRTVWDGNWGNFKHTYIWAQGGMDVNDLRQDDNTVICNGSNLAIWYRSSLIFGHGTLEWPYFWNRPHATVTPPAPGAVRVAKPLQYIGMAGSEFIHLGRYAEWRKGVLTSDVYKRAIDIFNADRI